jgi:hypothetical protein
MQVAHSSINAVGLPFADSVAEELSRLLVVARVEDVVVPLVLARVVLAGRLATCGALELPHAARPTAATATSGASPGALIAGARRRLIGRPSWVLCRMWPPSAVLSQCPRRFYASRGFRRVSSF